VIPGVRKLARAASRLAARVRALPLAKPASRVALVAAGLACLAAIGSVSVAGSAGPPPGPVAVMASAPRPPAEPASAASPVVAAPALSAPAAESPPASRGRASPEDPVFLNSAGVDDLRRLPGVGEKRANAILALRARLGRLRAVEDLLKVKGIGRVMLKRLRPLVRLDPKSAADGGAIEVQR
jgi:competence protein ComEA